MLMNWWMDSHMTFIQQKSMQHLDAWVVLKNITQVKSLLEKPQTAWLLGGKKRNTLLIRGKRRVFLLIVQKYSQFEYDFQWPVNIVFICKNILFYWAILFSGIFYYVSYFYKIIYRDYRYFLKNFLMQISFLGVLLVLRQDWEAREARRT